MFIESRHSERELLYQLANGSEQAFTAIYNQFSPGIYNAAMIYLKDDYEAQDIVQLVFLKLWDKREKMMQVEKLKDYLFILARNAIYDHFRKIAKEKKFRLQFSDELPLQVSNADYKITDEEYAVIYRKALELLPPKRKQIFIMSKEKGMSNNEIAGELRITRFTVKKQIYMALQQIRKFISQHISITILTLYIIASLFFH